MKNASFSIKLQLRVFKIFFIYFSPLLALEFLSRDIQQQQNWVRQENLWPFQYRNSYHSFPRIYIWFVFLLVRCFVHVFLFKLQNIASSFHSRLLLINISVLGGLSRAISKKNLYTWFKNDLWQRQRRMVDDDDDIVVLWLEGKKRLADLHVVMIIFSFSNSS